MSIARRSTGSCRRPSISRVSTCGLPTVSSKPSRRSVSTSTASCSSPRPCTSQVSGRSVGFTRIETLPTSSWSRRDLSSRAVSLSPERPASGEVLIPIVMPSAGSSTVTGGSGCGSSRVGDRVADHHVRQPRQGDDLTGSRLLRVHALHPVGDVQLGDPHLLHLAVAAAPGHGLAAPDRALVHAAERQPAHVRRRVQVGDERLQPHALAVHGARHACRGSGRTAVAGPGPRRPPRLSAQPALALV